MTQLWSIILVLITSPIGAYGALLLKKSSNNLRFKFWSIIRNKDLIYGVLLYGLATLGYIIALKGGELSIIYPLVSITYVWTVILSQKILHEKMNTYKWLGIIFILIGVSLIGIGS